MNFFIPNELAVKRGFKRKRRIIRTRQGRPTQCTVCNETIKTGDQYSVQEVSSPLCLNCHVEVEEE